MNVELDGKRISELETAIESDFEQIVAELERSMTELIERIELTTSSGELESAARAAHACRNDALLVDAQELLGALTTLEHAAVKGRRAAARDALARVRAVWPATRAALRRLRTSRSENAQAG
jgi:hypothetical protein